MGNALALSVDGSGQQARPREPKGVNFLQDCVIRNIRVFGIRLGTAGDTNARVSKRTDQVHMRKSMSSNAAGRNGRCSSNEDGILTERVAVKGSLVGSLADC